MNVSSQRGAVMLIALIICLLLGMTAASVCMLTAANSVSSVNMHKRAIALTLAEIGVERVKANIARGDFDSQFDTQDDTAVGADNVYAPDGTVYGSYEARVIRNYGGVTEQYLVVSHGIIADTTRRVRVVLRRDPPEVPDTSSAITLYNPTGLAAFRGMPPLVCGLDTDIPSGIDFASVKTSDCVPGSGDGPDAVGIGTHEDTSVVAILCALGTNADRVTGASSDGSAAPGSVHNVSTTNPSGRVDALSADDISKLVGQYELVADEIYSVSDSLATQPDLGTVSDPRVVVVRDTSGDIVRLGGNIAGAGVLIIDAPVQITGTFNYSGLIIITNRGNATVSLKITGTPLVFGAMLASNPGNETIATLDLRGTSDVFFSREGLDCARRALRNNAKFTVVYYTEEQPEDGLLTLPDTAPETPPQPW